MSGGEKSMKLRRIVRASSIALALLLALLCGTSHAGSIVFFESGAGPGVPLRMPAPANDAMLDIDYSPSSAEGAGLYGFSEVTIFATGDLNLSASGFVCQAFGCLWSPSPFTSGSSIVVSGADNLTGEFSGTRDLLRISVSGSFGYIAITSGQYLDAAGLAQGIGAIQTISPVILATVPEPGLAMALTAGCLWLAGSARRCRRAVKAPAA